MYALEPEPEQKGRWKRLGSGAGIALMLATSMVYGANKFEPTRRLIEKVTKIAVVVEAPKALPPEKPLPPPPPPKRLFPKQKSLTPQRKSEAAKPQSNEPQQVGLDESSFGEGEGGASFGVGNTAMGAPPTVYKPFVPKKEAPPPAPAVFRQARPLKAVIPATIYTESARKRGIQGLMVLEVDVDPTGKVTGVRIRRGLESGLDEKAVQEVRRLAFQPATRGGRAIASTYFVRLRYQLEG
jgi:protein TonB